MENTDPNYNENTAKCPYHAQLNAAQENNSSEDKDANTGDWDDEREDNRTTEEEGYDNDQNDNSGGAGSSGSASTNS